MNDIFYYTRKIFFPFKMIFLSPYFAILMFYTTYHIFKKLKPNNSDVKYGESLTDSIKNSDSLLEQAISFIAETDNKLGMAKVILPAIFWYIVIKPYL